MLTKNSAVLFRFETACSGFGIFQQESGGDRCLNVCILSKHVVILAW